ncbi:Uncharacterised protein [Legionella geestiana]|nr:Uncharacterised protein [Legionella geestiana]
MAKPGIGYRPPAGCFFRASCPALISAGYGIVLIIYNCAVGWAEHSEARHRISPAGRMFFSRILSRAYQRGLWYCADYLQLCGRLG